jgi:mycoredoxin
MHSSRIIVYGTNWCVDCYQTKKFLEKMGIEFEFINIDKNKEAEQFVIEVNHGMRSVPTILFEDGSILVEPTNKALADKIGVEYKQSQR